jgi:lipopolysaccharide transport system ATP-binding protein
MSDVAIRVEGLGKQYRLYGPTERYSTLRDQVRKWTSLRALLRRTRRFESRPPFWALKDVSFEVKPGEVVGIIGRNGAGKSTLLKILSRITEPTEGTADIQGRVGSLLEVGTGFHPELTGRENVFLNGAILGMKRAEIARKFDEIVAFAEVEKFIDTPVKHYSSGMYTRLAFAVAAHLEPEILIVDEVLAVGDAQFQKKCLGKMGEVAEGGRTVLFVSHNMQAVQRLCPWVVLLDRGQVAANGPSNQVVRTYIGRGLLTCAERLWDCDDPANQIKSSVSLVRARVLNEAGDLAPVVSIHRSFKLVVEYDNYLTDVRPTAIIQIHNEDGICLFSTNEFNCPGWRAKPLRPGRVTATCHVPGNLLAEGTFYVLVAVGSYNPNVVYSLERDALAFQVVDDSQGMGVRGVFTGDWPGVMRPILDWVIEHVDAVR